MIKLPWLGRIVSGLTFALSMACGGDDAVLVPVGGSSGTQSSSSGDINTGTCDLSSDDACPNCTSKSCGDAAEACFCPQTGSDTCDAYLRAQVKCDDPSADAGTPAQCEAALDQRFPRGSAASKALDTCQKSNCKAACGF